MLSAEEFNQRMERAGQLVAQLAEQVDEPAAIAARDLLATSSELHAAALERILALVRSGGEKYRPLLEQFAQDDLVRSLLLYHDLHPIALESRLAEAIANLRPIVESYGGSVSIDRIQRGQVTLRLVIEPSSGPSPVPMLEELLENAILVSAPDAGEVRFEPGGAPAKSIKLPIISAV
jgi:uncharacterized alpha-E superfamily protein